MPERCRTFGEAATRQADPRTFTGDPNHSPVSGHSYGYIVWLGSSSPPPTPPGAPTLDTATSGNAQVVLRWLVPTSSGSAAITNYKLYRGTSSNGERLLTTLGAGCASPRPSRNA